MNKKVAFITGIAGQDGSYLAEYLLKLDYKIFGIVRRNSTPEHQESRISHLENDIETLYGDLSDQSSLEHYLRIIKPNEIYNLAAQSHVRISFDIPQYTVQTNAIGVINILEAFKKNSPNSKFYQASSCLPAGTKILVRKEIERTRLGKKQKILTLGTKNIEELNINDEVLSMDLKTNKKEYKKITKIGNRYADDMFTIKFSNNNFLRLSGNHPVYVINKGWVRTDELKIGDEVIQKRYNGLFGGIIRKGKTNKEIFGENKANEMSKNISISLKNSDWEHPWKGKNIYELYKDDPEKCEYLRKIMSDSKKGIKPWNTNINDSNNNNHIKSWNNAKKNIGISNKKLWENEEFSKINLEKLIQRRPSIFKINKSEKLFLKFLDDICPGEFEYNEMGKLLKIGRKIPDFVNVNGKKKLIEYNGDFWHLIKGRELFDKKRINEFKKEGYETLTILESEFKFHKDNVKEKILKFLYNPQIDIIKITEIIKENREKVYDISVKDNHNFFAKGILVHNSEMFGNSVDLDGFQRETTPMNPTSPYGCAKVFGYNIVRHYRNAYKLFASNGILFNHESPRRGSNFVTNKVVKAAVRIKLGLQDKLVLGNMDSYRDWGHSKDYVRAMHLILNHIQPDDFIISTMQTHSVRDLVSYVFNKLQLDQKKYVFQDVKYMRAEELNYLRGDSSKARNILGWQPEYTFDTLLDEMIEYWQEIYNKEK